ncbi:MAG TPA: BACON domain-containing carbohydrate-binding protein, partial [Candidatus Sulfomarinibacteraceae bacterium]|nr:BACON domain-containing carbohydrate-binding protein [Candidatus Sulfomarinibacteraceae bacterium]
MNRSLPMSFPIRLAVLGVAAVVCLLAPGLAEAQGCFEHVRDYAYMPSNCDGAPEINRAHQIERITWGGKQYLVVDEGNEIRFYNIDNPLNPSSITSSHFNIPPFGDVDYNLMSFTVCDDCRYGVASYNTATVLFDLGTGQNPNFIDHTINTSADRVEGSFTFSYGGQQYLVASDLGTNPCPANDSGLYEFNGVDEAGNPRLQCLDGGGFFGVEIINGLKLEGGGQPPVLYLGDRFYPLKRYQIQTSPFRLNFLGDLGSVNMYRGKGAGWDPDAGLLAVAYDGVLKIYDVGYGNGTPANPIQIGTKALGNEGNAVAIDYPIVWTTRRLTIGNIETYSISTPSNPVSLDQDFWHVNNPWNALGYCVKDMQATFSADGSAMYLSRWSVLQVIDPTACAGPVEPVANLTVSPQPAFPGDLVTVTNTSLGGETYRTWITDGPSPHGSTWLAGQTSFGANIPATYTLPADMATTDVFYAHAAVQTVDFPYDPGGSTPDQVETRQITIDRTPEATITITPAAVITGDTVTLSAVAEGHPADPGGSNPFDWIVTDPSGTPAPYTGTPVPGVQISSSGQWTFDLEVQYRHANPVGGLPYVATAQEIRNITSVAAAFSIAPSVPIHNQTITLTSTSRAQAGATVDFDWDVLTPAGALVNELAGCDGVHAINYQCVIAPDTLTWGTYDFRLTLTNTGTSDQDTYLIEDVEVQNGNIQVDFSWSPNNPQIGQATLFSVTGVPAADIEQAYWTFGGNGCDGTSTYTCVEPNFPGCDQAVFSYASGGSKTVTLTLTTTGGVQQPPVSNVVSVQSTGSCGGTSCTYSISPTSRNFSGDGGTGSITVTTQSGCTWTASENVSWITITSGSSGSGSGTVTYQVAANTGEARSATITAAGRSHVVNQASGIVCQYWLTTQSAVFGPPGGAGSFTINTSDASCAWQATSLNTDWLTVNTPSGTGPGPVNYVVAANDTPHQRIGAIRVTGSGETIGNFTVTQNHPWIPVNFEFDVWGPKIGETVTFSTDPRLEVESWSFTSPNCQGDPPVINCPGQPGVCTEIEWAWASAGPKEVVLTTTTGPVTKTVTVQNSGECPPYCGKDGPPTASFTIDPSPALEDEQVVFTDTSGGGLKVLATGITWDPTAPEIGELTLFTITGHAGEIRAEW